MGNSLVRLPYAKPTPAEPKRFGNAGPIDPRTPVNAKRGAHTAILFGICGRPRSEGFDMKTRITMTVEVKCDVAAIVKAAALIVLLLV